MLSELLATEESYVEDLHSVLCGYRDRLDTEAGEAEDEELKQKADDIFGNMEEIFEFHSGCLLPDLERCGGDVRRVGKTFLEYSDDIRKIYCRCTTNITMATKFREIFHNIQVLTLCLSSATAAAWTAPAALSRPSPPTPRPRAGCWRPASAASATSCRSPPTCSSRSR